MRDSVAMYEKLRADHPKMDKYEAANRFHKLLETLTDAEKDVLRRHIAKTIAAKAS